MKTIRKVLALVLALCIVLSLAACTGGKDPDPTKTPDASNPPANPTEEGNEPADEVELLWWAPPTFIQDADV